MAFQIEHFDNAFPNGLFSEPFHHEHRLNVSHWTARSLLDRALNILDAIAAHASIMCTESRTVDAKLSTPAAIAGVQRIAMLDFMKA
jgi:hypothetical protein